MMTSVSSAGRSRHLTLLGGVRLTGSLGSLGPAGSRRRPLALLSILAASGERGTSRERLLLYLWPESDARHGRNALNQTLYSLRRDLGAEELILGTTTLVLNPAVIGCDVWDFERAIEGGRDEDAAALYGGPFLHDFSVPGLPEFDQWIDRERKRLERIHQNALKRLAEKAEASGDRLQALRWWRRLAAAAPLSATGAVGLIRALADAGDWSAALEYARTHAALVRVELDSEPDPSVLALVEQIRRRAASSPSAAPQRASEPSSRPTRAMETERDARARGLPGVARDDAASTRVPTEPARSPPPAAAPTGVEPTGAGGEVHGRQQQNLAPDRDGGTTSPLVASAPPSSYYAPVGRSTMSMPPAAPDAGATSARRSRRWRGDTMRRLAMWLLPLIVAVALALVSFERAGRSPPANELAGPRVAVLPFRMAVPDSFASMTAGIMDMLSASLDGADVEVVDPGTVRRWMTDERLGDGRSWSLAQDVGAMLRADNYVTGEATLIGDRVRVIARWYTLDGSAGSDGTPSETLVARASAEGEPAQLLAVVDRLATELLAGRHVESAHLVRAAADGTRVPEAFKAFLRGEREFRAGEYTRATDEYARAATIDSTFALAYYRLGIVADRAGRDSLSRLATARASALAGSLAGRHRALVLALVAQRRGELDVAERHYRDILSDYPDDGEAWRQLGELLFHGNPLVGRSATEARQAFEQVLRLDPGSEEALVHLARIAALEGRRAMADSVVTRLLARREATGALELHDFRCFALGLGDRRTQATTLLERSPGIVSPRTALSVAVGLDGVAGERAFARELARPGNPRDARAVGLRLLARAEAARGRPSVAWALLDSAQARDTAAALEVRSLLAVAPFLEASRQARTELVGAVSAWQPGAERPAILPHSSTHAGLHPHLRLHRLGLLYASLGQPTLANEIADSILRRPLPSSVPPETGRVLAQSVRATAAHYAGRHAEALTILMETPWPVVAFALDAEAHDRFIRAETLRALGQFDQAAGWYASIAERAPHELVYLAPSELRLGELFEARGDLDQAVRHYRRFVDLWQDADPALRPQVNAVRRRVAELTQTGALPGAGGRGRT